MSDLYALPENGPVDSLDALPPLTPVGRITNTFAAPTKTFADLRRNRAWWLPFVLLAICSYIFAGAALGHIGLHKLAESTIRSNPKQNERMQQASPEQRAQTLQVTATIIQVSLIASPVFLLLFSAIGALLLWVGFNFILGGKATFSGMFAVLMFAWLPSILRTLLITLLVFVSDPEGFNLNDPAGTNPGFFLGADSPAFLKSLLGSLDIFSIWILALAAIGGAIVARVKITKGVALVFIAWIIFVLLKAGVVGAMS